MHTITNRHRSPISLSISQGTNPPRKRRIFAGIVVCWAVCWAVPAVAQDFVEPTEAQWELNDKALEAMRQQEYEKAIKLFDAALVVSDVNLFHLNRGRALQRLGRCKEAEKAFSRTLNSPPVSDPKPDEILSSVERFRGASEIAKYCPGELLLTCTPSEMEITIDGRNHGTCSSKPIELARGTYFVRGVAYQDATELQVEITGGKTVPLTLTIPLPQARAKAEKLVAQAREMKDPGQQAQALDLLRQAAELAANWEQPLRLLAEAETNRKNYASAMKWYGQYLTLTRGEERARVQGILQELERQAEQERLDLEAARRRQEQQRQQDEQGLGVNQWIWIGSGATAIVAGGVMDLVPGSSRDGELGAADFIPVGLYVAGAAAVIVGLFFVEPDSVATPETAPSTMNLPGFSPADVRSFYLGPEMGWVEY